MIYPENNKNIYSLNTCVHYHIHQVSRGLQEMKHIKDKSTVLSSFALEK